ncbi:MAG: thrombospondin type 3 repeat-containing protein [Deltaproteobacteria bacterium]|nr:thrombospondin type 3 repeat-containing protein [Deltaproteobacteria bacterium]
MPSTRLPRLLLALSLALAAGCGGGETPADDAGVPDAGTLPDSGPAPDDPDGDEWPDSMDNCPAVANPEQRDRDLDGIGDACDTCPSTPNNGTGGQVGQDACDAITESEPNDTIGAGEMVSLVQEGRVREIRGAVEPPTPEGNQAFDRFRFMAGARTMLRVRVARASPDSLLEPLVVVTGDGYAAPRMADGLFVAARDIYIPSAGMYEIAVADRRGVLDGAPIGSLEFAYALSIEARPLELSNRTPPLIAEPFILDEEGKVPVMDLALDASEFTLVGTETDLGLGASDLGADTILVVERADGTVLENDDLADGFIDSRVVVTLPLQETLRVVLDHSRLIGPGPHEVRLTVDQPDTSRELEPNGTPELASELVFPGETSGRIDAPRDPNVGPPDLDWYYLDGRAGQVLALTGLVRPAAVVNPVMALVRVYDWEAGDFELLYQNTDSSGEAPRIEAILPETDRYYVVVGDELNLGDPPFAGGPLFEYGIFAELTGIQPDPNIITSTAALSGVLDPGGRLKRHLVTVAGPTLLFIDASSFSPDVTPHIRVYGPGARGLLGDGVEEAMAFLPTAESYVLAVHNDNNGLGGAQATYSGSVGYQAVEPKTEVEPNDAQNQATALAGWRDVGLGELASETDKDTFTITATGGLTLDAVLTTGGRGRQVQLTNDAGAVLAAGAGQITGVPLPALGAYYVQITGPAGPYTLAVRAR